MSTLLLVLALITSSGPVVLGDSPGDLQWKFPAGPGASGLSIDIAGPVFDADGVIFMSRHPNWTIFELNRLTGEQWWNFTPPANTTSASATEISSNGLYFVVGDGSHSYLYTFQADMGSWELGWTMRMPYGSEPAGKARYSGNLLYLGLGGPGGGLFAIEDKITEGRVKWQADCISTASNVEVGEYVYAICSDFAVHAYDLLTGKEVWVAPNSAGNWASPLLGFHTVFSTLPNMLLCLDDMTGEVIWRVNIPISNPLTPILDDERIFVSGASNTLFAFNQTTGEALWNVSELPPTEFWSNPLFATDPHDFKAGRVFIGSSGGVGQLHVLDPQNGALLWNFTAPAGVRSPALIMDLVYFGVGILGEIGTDAFYSVRAFPPDSN